MTKVFCEIMFTSFVRLEWMITSQAIGSTNTEWFTWKAEISLQLFLFVVAFACINHRAMWLFIIAHVWLDYCEIFFFVLNLFFLIYISLIKKRYANHIDLWFYSPHFQNSHNNSSHQSFTPCRNASQVFLVI